MYKYIYIFVGMAGVMARLPRVWGEADNLSIPSPRLPSDASATPGSEQYAQKKTCKKSSATAPRRHALSNDDALMMALGCVCHGHVNALTMYRHCFND